MFAELFESEELNTKLKIPSVLELIEITIKRNEWHLKTPFQKWSYLYGIGKACIRPTGFSAFDNDLTIKNRSYFIVSLVLIYLMLGIYTVFYYTKNGEFVKCLPCTCLYCIALTV